MAKKQTAVNTSESKSGYTGKYFRYDQASIEQNILEPKEDAKDSKKEKNKKKKK